MSNFVAFISLVVAHFPQAVMVWLINHKQGQWVCCSFRFIQIS